jgi:hypothetical protein
MKARRIAANIAKLPDLLTKPLLSGAAAFFKTQIMKSESVSSLRTATIGLSDLQ